MHVLVVGGGGTIGSTVAYTLATQHPSLEVTLADPKVERAEGHAIDLFHSRSHAAHAIGRPEFETSTLGDVSVIDPTSSPGPDPVEAADAIVVTASEPRSPDSFQRGGRLSVLERNLEIASDLGEWFASADPTPTVVVANPSDRVTHRLWEASGWPRGSFLGYSLSETARIADEIARRVSEREAADGRVSAADVYCPILGEHGEHMVPVFSRTTIDGRPVEFPEAERAEILDYVRSVPYDVIDMRDNGDSSRWVTGRGISLIVSRLLEGGTDPNSDPVCLATPLDGEYGLEGVSLSVPVVLDETGVAEIVEWELSADERQRLERAAESIRESLEHR
ncbi:malate dehydrogenase [Natronorubrum sediminis]|uniref:malate dehydrogenase n=1 Tax=Natronorubrum sediminis TaxID=640943 RepID=A0A1H6FVX9_9EURY|nr:lactate dehydrogenase [Natronorubrum sediminis]SEH14440.1 malate dehydrogenase [Natronorubrum sediminis]